VAGVLQIDELTQGAAERLVTGHALEMVRVGPVVRPGGRSPDASAQVASAAAIPASESSSAGAPVPGLGSASEFVQAVLNVMRR
jgi:hypothetical protein